MKVKSITSLLILIFLVIPVFIFSQAKIKLTPKGQYASLQRRLAKGWNTWNTNSVTSYVYLPEGIAINLIFKDTKSGVYLKNPLIGEGDEKIQLIEHTYDGSYTELKLQWHRINVTVQSATIGDDQVILISPDPKSTQAAKLIVQPKLLWGKAGMVSRSQDEYSKTVAQNTLFVYLPNKRIEIYATGKQIEDNYIKKFPNVFVTELSQFQGISTGKNRSLIEVQKIIEAKKREFQLEKMHFGEFQQIYEAMETVLAWNTIYDPSENRVITPVSRAWSSLERGGYVLFCWDTFFAAYMLALDNKDLAYANIVEVTKAIDKLGFVPNHNGGNDISRDRSQPPIGSLVVKAIYEKYHEKWILQKVYNELLSWNRWWSRERDVNGYLCWGSTPYKGMEKSIYNTNPLQRAKWESGMDNSPMYDNIGFDSLHSHTMLLADVGLMSLYISDCKALAGIAHVLGNSMDEKELKDRGVRYSNKLQSMWNEKSGIYLNKRIDNGKFSMKISPTNFYPLLAKVPNQLQAERMIKEHLLNPIEFEGAYMLPSIARNDPAFKDNNYWRGRIWGPLNFLVYLGLRNYNFPEAKAELLDKSKRLLLKGWLSKYYIFENYNAITGEGNDVPNSDHFYHWGALLGFMDFIDKGWMQPESTKHY